MIPNVRRGQDMVRLIKYLVGPGKRNEHTDPHLVAGSSWQMAWHSDAELSYADATAMGKDLEAPTRAFGVEVSGGHVWHCSLSLDAAEGRLADDEWAEIAEQFMTRMGFVTDDLEQPSLRWWRSVTGCRATVTTIFIWRSTWCMRMARWPMCFGIGSVPSRRAASLRRSMVCGRWA